MEPKESLEVRTAQSSSLEEAVAGQGCSWLYGLVISSCTNTFLTELTCHFTLDVGTQTLLPYDFVRTKFKDIQKNSALLQSQAKVLVILSDDFVLMNVLT